MSRAVVLAGGWAHPGHDLIAAVQTLLDGRGFDVVAVTAPEHVAAEIEAGCDLLVAGCCWFAMADDRYTHRQRQQYAVDFDGELREVVTNVLDAGCPVLALHTAVISFDGAEPWVRALGGTWNWTNSWHPEPASMLVEPAVATPIAFEAFSVVDELYQGLDMSETATVVAESANGDPLVWLHQQAGRAAVNLLGHDQRSLAHPAHRALNEQLLDWLLAVRVQNPD